MKQVFNKEYCFWIVPKDGGAVKKVRFKLVHALFVFLFAVFGLGTSIVAVSGFAKTQFKLASNWLHLRSLSLERDTLISSNEELTSKLDQLLSVQDESDIFKHEIKQKMSELARALKSVSLPELAQAPEAPHSANNSKEGVGGAERSCGDSCPDLSLSKGSLNLSTFSSPSNKELILSELDKVNSIIRAIPIGAPVAGNVSSNFGYRMSPFEMAVKFHEGIDYSVPRGTPVYATADGVVSDARFDRTYGWKIDIEHLSGLETRYGHLSRMLVKKGDRIKRGDKIGLVGSTGRSTGPHLHYEVLVKKSPKDPQAYIRLENRLQGILNSFFG